MCGRYYVDKEADQELRRILWEMKIGSGKNQRKAVGSENRLAESGKNVMESQSMLPEFRRDGEQLEIEPPRSGNKKQAGRFSDGGGRCLPFSECGCADRKRAGAYAGTDAVGVPAVPGKRSRD